MADFITLEEYKAFKGKLSANTAEDTRISIVITSVSAAIKEYIGRTLIDNYSTTMTKYSNGNTNTILLDEYPIHTAVVSYKDSATTYVAMIEGEDYYLDAEYGEVISTTDDVFNLRNIKDPRFFKVEYTGGFAEAPLDIKMACADWVEKVIKQEHSVMKNMGGQDVMNFPSSPQGRIPNHIGVILDMYRVPLM